MKKTLLVLSLAAVSSLSAGEWTHLLDKDLSKFEIWMGIPHVTTKGLPEGTPTSEDCHKGIPMGLGADIKQVFSVVEEDGEAVLHISGEIFGGLTTLDEYENYHFSTKFRWGDKKWEPRLDLLRDNGILYHAHGDHGAFWGVWKSCLEFQVQETDLGDFIALAGPSAEVRSNKDQKRPRFDMTSDEYYGGYVSAFPEPDEPHGEWNQLDLYTHGDTSVHVVNGIIVMVVENARYQNGSVLSRGQIQIQSEAAECAYKDMKIKSLKSFPKWIQTQLKLKD